MNIKLFLVIISSLFLIQSCEAQSQLPVEMPDKLSFSFHEGGGMSRAYKEIKIENGVLEFEELDGNEQDLQKWSVNISREDLAKLYKAFVENKFDAIKNDKRVGIVYDAGSETITVSINKTTSFQVTYGKNSPLSGKNLQRYQAVKKSFFDFLAQHQKQNTDNSSNKNQTTLEPEKYIQGTWRTGGENAGNSWYLEWTFDNEKFKQLGYPPITQEGKYKVISVENNKITLELYDQKGTFGDEKRELQILIDKETKKLTISGTKDFSRVPAEKNN